MKPTLKIHLLRLALLAGAPLLFGSPVMLAADSSDSDQTPAVTAPSPPPNDRPPPPPPDEFSPDDSRSRHHRPERQPPSRRPEGMTKELAAVEKFLDMSPEQLAMIRNLIARIEQMSDEEKEELRARIRKIREMDADRRQELMESHRQIPWEERMVMHQYWRSLPEAERKQLWEEMKNLSPEERLAHRQEILKRARAAGFDETTLPPPPERPFYKRLRPDNTSGENAPGTFPTDKPQPTPANSSNDTE